VLYSITWWKKPRRLKTGTILAIHLTWSQ